MGRNPYQSHSRSLYSDGHNKTLLAAFLLCIALLFVPNRVLAFKLPDTGQTKCYQAVIPYAEIPCAGTGQDGEYNINPMSYTDNGDGTVTDNNTGLIWQQQDDGNTYNWYQASGTYDATYNLDSLNVCGSLNLGGYSDWRLPTKKELITIVDYSVPPPGPTISAVFATVSNGERYWSSTTFADLPYDAWDVDFWTGLVQQESKNIQNWVVRCVRGVSPEDIYIDNGDGTGTDVASGLVWTTSEVGSGSWEYALQQCASLQLAGYSDWRLPNVREVAWRPSVLIDTFYNWSSTTFLGSSRTSAYINSYDSIWLASKSDGDFIDSFRCVRGGQSGSLGSLTISPSFHDFGSLNIGDHSFAWYFNVTNTSQAPVTISTVELLWANSSDFYIAYDLCSGSTLLTNEQCRTWVSFWPSSYGLKQASLAITADGITTTATLTGTGGLNNGNATLSGKITTNAGAPLGGASINMGDYSTTSGPDGSYSISGITAGDYTIILSKTGYITYQRPVSLPPATAVIQNMYLVPSGQTSDIKVNSITSKYNGFLYFLYGTDFNVTFAANVDWGGHPPQKVRFISSNGAYDVATNTDSASYSFNTATEFDPCTTLTVVAISSDNNQSAPKQADFTVMSPLPGILVSWVPVDLGDGYFYHTKTGFDFTFIDEAIQDGVIPKDMPLFGKSGINLRMVPTLEARVGSDGAVDIGFEWDNVSLLEKKVLKGTMAGTDFKLNLAVGISGKYKHPACVYDWGGSLGLSGGAELHGSWPFTLGPVPVPLYVAATFKVGTDAAGTVNNISPLNYSLTGEITPSLRGSVGVGLDRMVSVEGWLEGGGTLGLQYPQTPHLNKLELFVEGGVTAYALLWSWENSALRWDYDMLGQNAQRISSQYLSPASSEVGDIKPRLVSRDYLNILSSGKFLNKPKLSLNVPSLIAPQVVTSSGVIQSSVFPYSEAHLSSNSTTGLVWVEDKPDRTDINRTMVVSSFWNGSSWSTPQPILDDGTADFHPQIITFDDGSAIAAWEDENIVQPDGASFVDMVKHLEIAVARYNSSTAQWTGGTRLRVNDYLDRSPKLSGVAPSNVMVSWISNPSNSLTGSASAPNTLYAALFDGNFWSVPFSLAQVPYPILSYDLYYGGITPEGTILDAVFSIDLDGDLSTIDDHELFRASIVNPGAITRITNDNLSDDSPHITKDENGIPIVIWLKGGQLVSAPVSDIVEQTVIYTDEYSSNLAAFSLARSSSGRISLTWQEPTSQNPSDLKGIFYDPTTKTWSAPRQLTSDAETERGITTAFTSADTLMAVYNRNITGPNPGLSDLYMVLYSLGSDLALQDGSLAPSPQTPQPGQAVTFTVTALNPGDKAADSVTVAFYNGDPAGSSILLGQTVVPQVLKPGDSVDVSFDWTVPEGTTPIRIYAVIDPGSVFDTTNRANNTVYCDIVNPDLAIQTTSSQMMTDTLISITARVINKGSEPAEATTVTFRNDNAAGTIISTNDIPALDIGEAADVNIQLDISAHTLSYYTIFIAVDEGNAVAEMDKSNNTETMTVIVDGNCTYTLGAPSTTAASTGGPYILAITTNSPDCTWQAISNETWITLQGSTSGTGSGTLACSVAPNSFGIQRIGTITVARQTFTVTQAGLTYSIGLDLQGAAGRVTTLPGTTCTSNCSVNISAGKEVTLYPSGQCSYFTGWGDACAGQSTFCQLTMTADMQVNASFTAYPEVWNKNTETGDASINNVYLNAANGAEIDIQAKEFTEAFQFNRSVSVTLKGGFDCNFTANEGTFSTLTEPVVFGGAGSGTVTVENIVVQ